MEYSYGSATGENDSVVMAGFTTGHWSGQGAGVADFMAVKLDTSNGVTEAWRWQVRGSLSSETLRWSRTRGSDSNRGHALYTGRILFSLATTVFKNGIRLRLAPEKGNDDFSSDPFLGFETAFQ